MPPRFTPPIRPGAPAIDPRPRIPAPRLPVEEIDRQMIAVDRLARTGKVPPEEATRQIRGLADLRARHGLPPLPPQLAPRRPAGPPPSPTGPQEGPFPYVPEFDAPSAEQMIGGEMRPIRPDESTEAGGISADMWSFLSSGSVGNQVQVDPADPRLNFAAGGRGIPLINLTGPDKYAEVYTVSLELPSLAQIYPIPVAPALPRDPRSLYAFVEWGNGGKINQAIVDFLQGMTFAVSGSTLRVTLFAQAIANAFGTNIFFAGATASKLPSPKAIPPQFSLALNPGGAGLAPAAALTAFVPQWTQAIQIQRTPIGGQSFLLEFQDYNATVLWQTAVGAGQTMAPVAVDNRARVIVITNTSAAGNAHYVQINSLAL